MPGRFSIIKRKFTRFCALSSFAKGVRIFPPIVRIERSSEVTINSFRHQMSMVCMIEPELAKASYTRGDPNREGFSYRDVENPPTLNYRAGLMWRLCLEKTNNFVFTLVAWLLYLLRNWSDSRSVGTGCAEAATGSKTAVS